MCLPLQELLDYLVSFQELTRLGYKWKCLSQAYNDACSLSLSTHIFHQEIPSEVPIIYNYTENHTFTIVATIIIYLLQN